MASHVRSGVVLATAAVLAGCGSGPVGSPGRTVDPPAGSDLAIVDTYLRAVISRDCASAQRVMMESARHSHDLCASGAPALPRIDAWRLGPRALWASGTVVEGVPVELHFAAGPSGAGSPRWVLYDVPLMQVRDTWRVESGVGRLRTCPSDPQRLAPC